MALRQLYSVVPQARFNCYAFVMHPSVQYPESSFLYCKNALSNKKYWWIWEFLCSVFSYNFLGLLDPAIGWWLVEEKGEVVRGGTGFGHCKI